MRLFKFVSSVVGFALLLQGVVPAYAEVSETSFVAEDYISARLQAELTHHRILITSELSESSTTWVNPDGTLTTESFGAPVRVRDEGGLYGWRDLDYSLIFDDSGFVKAVSGRFDLRISGGGSASEVAASGLVSIAGTDGHQFGFGWEGGLPKPVLEGDTARFVDVLPQVDLLVRLNGSGFEQFFEVKAKPDQSTLDKLSLLVKGKNVLLEPDGNGGYKFISGSKVLGSVPTPVMYGSASGASAPVTQELEPTVDSTGVLDLAVPGSFFERTDLEYPVIVDPSVVLSPTFDTYVSNAYPSTDFQSSTELLVGTPDGGTSVYRSFLNFDSTGWIGQDIISANLKLYLNWSWSCAARNFSIYATSPATPSTRWGNAPTIGGTGIAKIVAAGYNSSCPAATITTDVTSLAKIMPGGTTNTAGFGIKAASETDSFGWKRFNSSDASANRPSLTITYNRYPNTPSIASVSDSSLVGGVTTTGSWRPTLSSTATDPDGGNVTLDFRSYADSAFTVPIGSFCTVTVASGAKGSCQPATPLTNGQTYYVKVSAFDGSASSLSLSAGKVFKLDTTQPTAPTISCPYGNNYQGGILPIADFTCTVSTSASTASYRAKSVVISVDNKASITLDANADGSSSQQVVIPAGAYQHVITANAISATAIRSETTSRTMSFDYWGVGFPLEPKITEAKQKISAYALPQNGANPAYATVYWAKDGDQANWYQAVSGLPIQTKNGLAGLYDYTLDITTFGDNLTPALPHNIPVAFDLKVCFYYSALGEEFCTDNAPVTVTRAPSEFSNKAAVSAGLGQVSTTNGKFRISASDVSQQVGLDSLSVSRVFEAGQSSSTAQARVFGVGWRAVFSSDASALSSYSVSSDSATSHYYLVATDGEFLDYKFAAGVFTAYNTEAKQANLTLSGSATSFTVTETDSSQTTFTKSSSNVWRQVCTKAATDSRAVVTEYDSSGLVSSTGYVSGSCTTPGTLTQGLRFTYTTVASKKLLQKVDYVYLTNSGVETTQPRVTYGYDASARLTSVHDETDGSTTGYEYGSTGFLVKQTESGFDSYIYKYDASNRLVQVQRSHPGFFGDVYSVVQSFAYNIPVSGNTGLLPNLAQSKTAIWGQNTAPSYAVAEFGADTSLSLDASGNLVLPASTDGAWRNASFSFFDSQGYLANTADYGSNDWLYTATLLNSDGSVAASFDEFGISRVLARYAAEGNANFDGLVYATVNHYLSVINGITVPYNTYLSEQWSPIREITDSSGASIQVRSHTTYTYDQGLLDHSLHGLLSTTIVGLTYGFLITSIDSQVLSKTENAYTPLDGSTPTSPTSGWTLAKPTIVSNYVGLTTLVSKATMYYNSYGQIIKSQSIDPSGTVLHETNTSYYSVSSTDSRCQNKPAWQDLPCLTQTGETIPLSSVWVSEYDANLNATTSLEYRSGTQVRTTTSSYRADGLIDWQAVSSPGAATVLTQHTYDPTTSLETKTVLSYDGVIQSEVSKTYDSWGRETSSTNSLGETTNTSYVASGLLGAGSVSQIVSPKTTTSYTYGGGSEYRPVVTAMTVSSPDFSYQYTGVYDQFGRLTSQSGPNGLTQTLSFNDSGQVSSMSYGSVTSNVYTWVRSYDFYGRVFKELDPTGQTTAYLYDSSSRLISASNAVLSESYGYDSYGDRTSRTLNNVTDTHTFNTESQLTNSGYVYDLLGRNTYIPSFDAPNNGGAISLSYNVLDQVSAISQGTTTTAFTYDALGRRVNETANGLTTVRHYTESSDNPEWSTQVDGSIATTEIYTGSLGSGLGVTTNLKGTTKTQTIQLTDLKGHTVTALNLATNSVSPWSTYDSFGNPQTSQTNTNLINYSSYSQQERATNTTGLILMGARVYNPETNQFTSKDPIPGGNENSYTYPNDPMNNSDFTGCWDWLDSLDLTLTVLSILPIPGLQEIAWVARAASYVSKGMELASTILKTRKFVKVTQDAVPAVEGVYEYLIKGKWYVGQSKNLARRLAEHKRQWKVKEFDQIRIKTMKGSSSSSRREVEQLRINKRGGIDKLHNSINAKRKGKY